MTKFWVMFAAGMIEAMGGGASEAGGLTPSSLPKPAGWAKRKFPDAADKKKDLP